MTSDGVVWCPECGDEFRAGVAACPDCGVALVTTRPVAPAAPERARPPGLHGEFRPDDDIVELVRLPPVEAELVAGRIREAGVRVQVLGADMTSELRVIAQSVGARLIVYRGDFERARAILDRTGGDDLPLSEADLADIAEHTEWTDQGDGAVI
jgi:hypothetical protein